MPSSGKKKLSLNVVPILGMQLNILQLYLASGRAECKCKMLEQSVLELAHSYFPRLGEWDLGMEGGWSAAALGSPKELSPHPWQGWKESPTWLELLGFP